MALVRLSSPFLGIKPIQPPSDFASRWQPSFTVFEDQGVFRTTLNWEELRRPTGTVYYVDGATGNNADSGLTWALAKQTIAGAYSAASSGDTIYIMAGTYDGEFTTNHTKSLKYIGIGEVIVIFDLASPVWTLGDSGVYSTPYTYSNARPVDFTNLNADGDARVLLLAADYAGCAGTVNTYWVDDPGNLLYVHTFDARAPDADLYVGWYSGGANFVGAITVYLENLTFRGGFRACRAVNSGANKPTLYARGCKFMYAVGNGFEGSSATLAILRDCIASGNGGDGFDYSTDGSYAEIDCEGRWNGASATESNSNGSTGHNDCNVVCVGGEYHHNRGPNIADVNTVHRWCLGTYAHDSAAAAAGSVTDYLVTDTMWLDTCRAAVSTKSIAASGAGVPYQHLGNFPGTWASTLERYTR